MREGHSGWIGWSAHLYIKESEGMKWKVGWEEKSKLMCKLDSPVT